MITSPWKVSIISTDYDLHDMRSLLASTMKELGFEVLAFKSVGYPVEPRVHGHEACLLAIDPADIVLILVDKTYGGLYLDAGPLSITESEYDTAYTKEKIIIPCIRDSAWQERYCLFDVTKQLQSSDGLSIPDIRVKIKPKYVDKWETLDFIEKIRKADIDNFVITFGSPDDLCDKLKGRLRGLSRYIVQQIVQKQVNHVQSTKTTSGIGFSIGDVLEKGYFVEPPIEIKSGIVAPESSASDLLEKLYNQDTTIALFGGPGSGKSTLLAKAFLSHAKHFIEKKDYRIPLFIMLRGRGADYHFLFNQYIKECLNNFLSKSEYPAFSMESLRPVFYMDGFDELTEEVASIDLGRICKSDFFNSPFALSCRSRFAINYLSDITFGSKLSLIVELKPWDKDTAYGYVRSFCRIRKREDLISKIEDAFLKSPDMQGIAANPLLLTLFLWIVEESGMSLPLEVVDKLTLYDKCIGIWAKRDLARLTGNVVQEDSEEVSILRRAWEIGSWEIYRCRFGEQKKLKLDELIGRISNVSDDLKQVCGREAFTGVFDIRPHSETVTGMLHEELLEHLVASVIVDGIKENRYPFPECLEYIIRPEINRNIRYIWRTYGLENKKIILNNLWGIYIAALDTNTAQAVMRRNLVAYYIGRMDTEEAKSKMIEMDNIEKDPLVKLSIGFGLIKQGDFVKEAELLGTLRRDPSWDLANRGYHLVYYRDWDIRERKSPFYDPENIPWNKTLNALLRHIQNPKLRHVALRRVELYTIRRFVETRNHKEPISSDIMDLLQVAIESPVDIQDVPDKYHELVKHELDELRAAWLKIP